MKSNYIFLLLVIGLTACVDGSDDFVTAENLIDTELQTFVDNFEAEAISRGFDIDVEGATSIKRVYGDDAMVVFIKPPSPEVLFERLRKRKTETAASLEKRINRARRELAYENKFDRILINDDLDTALNDAEKLIRKVLKI